MALNIDRVQLEIIIQQDTARQQMLQLEKEMKQARTELTRVKKQFGENSEEYRKQEQVLKDVTRRYDEWYNKQGVASLSLKELTNRQRELNTILRNMNPNTPQFKEYSEQLRQVNNRIRELRTEAMNSESAISRFRSGFSKVAGIVAGAAAAVTGFVATVRKCVKAYAEMEEAMAQAKKYTGLTKEQIVDLNEEFKKMDTRKARTRLNELAGDAGRLGIHSKQKILEFVEAADQIDVALGNVLGESAVKNIGKLAMAFGDDKNKGLKGAMLSTGSAINQLAMESSASEDYMLEFTARVAGAGIQAKMSQQDILGYASVLDQNMQKQEMSATAFQKLIMTMYKAPEKFSREMEMPVKEFSKLIKEDINGAVLQLLQTFSEKGGLDKLAPVFKDLGLDAARAAGVISTLAGKIEDIKEAQRVANIEYEKAVSVTNEYNVANSTAQAELDKAKKKFNDLLVSLGEKLKPLSASLMTTTSGLIRLLDVLTSFIINNSKEIMALAKGIAAYTVYVNAGKIATLAYEAAVKVATLATRAFNLAIKSNPIGLVVGLLATAIAYFVDWGDEVDDAAEKQKNFNAQLEKTNKLLGEGKDIGRMSSSKKVSFKDDVEQTLDALNEEIDGAFNKINEKYNKKIEDTRKNWSGADRQNRMSELEYLRKKEIEKKEKELKDAIAKRDELAAILARLKEEAEKKEKEEEQQRQIEEEKRLADEKFNELVKRQKELNEAEMNNVKKLYADKGHLTEEEQEEYNRKIYNAEVAGLTKLKALHEQNGKDSASIQGDIYDRMMRESERRFNEEEKVKKKQEKDSQKWEQERKKKQQEELKKEDNRYNEEQSRVKKAYLDGDIQREEDYQKRLDEILKEHIEERKRILEEFNQDTAAEDVKLMDIDLKEKKKKKGDEKERREKELENANVFDKTDILQAMYDADLISYDEYERQKTEIGREQNEERQRIAEDCINAIGEAAGAASEVFQSMQDIEVRKSDAAWDKKIKAAKKAGKDTTKLEEQKEKEQYEIKKKYADKQFAATVMQVIATTAVTAMESYKAMAGIPYVGPVLGAMAAASAIAAGAVQIATAKQQRDEAKGLKTGGFSEEYVEGFTSRGDSNDVAGAIPVHKNEFVTNAEGVANPHVRQFLDVFNDAQRGGTIRMLNTTQILERVKTREGLITGGFSAERNESIVTSDVTVNGYETTSNLQMVRQMQRTNELLETMVRKNPYIDSRLIKEEIDKVNKLERNASR